MAEPGKRYTVLVVDDTPDNLALMAAILKEQYIVKVARSGERALQIAAGADRPDLILLDVMMPELDGYEVIQRLQQSEATRSIPVIFVTAMNEVENEEKGFALGAVDYLTKPVNPAITLARVKTHLMLHERTQTLRELSGKLSHSLAQAEATQHQLVDQQRRLRAELTEAAAYVASRLPPPLTGRVQTTWQSMPSEQLGGDAFGYHWLDDRYFAMYVLDVCGHGVGAALLSASILNVLQTKSLPGTDLHDPAAVLQTLNDRFPMAQHRNMFFTMWYGVYDQQQGRLVYANGGHPPAILLTGATANDLHVVRLHTPGGLVLGCKPGVTFPHAVSTLDTYSTLYLFSDGIYEIARPDGSRLSFDAFVEILTRATPSVPCALTHIVDAMRAISGSEVFADDVSLLQITLT